MKTYLFLLRRYTGRGGILSHSILLYMFLPFTIFLLGWVKLIISIPIVLILIFCYLGMVKNFPELWLPSLEKKNYARLIFIFCIILFWVYLSGIGGFVAQNSDHNTRNVMFKALVSEDWPVKHLSPPNEFYDAPIALVYYLGSFLPPAIIGKLFGLTAGSIAQMLWASIGIFLFYYLVIAKYVKKIVIWPLTIFIFFSGLDILGLYFTGNDFSQISSTSHIEWWAVPFQFSSMTTQLFWVFNQSVPAWLATMLLIIQKENRYIAIILALTMISSTLPFIGLILVAVFVATKNIVAEDPSGRPKKLRSVCGEIFSLENIFGGASIGIISFLYLNTNISGTRISLLQHHSLKGTIFLVLLFLLLEAIVYFIAVYKYQKNNYLFYCAAILLAICPWIHLGANHDFCMRASIPALIILYCLVIDTLNKSVTSKNYLVAAIIAILLVIGSVTPLKEITRTTANTIGRYRAQRQIAIEDLDPMNHPHRDNFYGYIEGSIFFDNLSKIGDGLANEN